MNRAIREKFALADLFFGLEAAAEGPERSVQPGAEWKKPRRRFARWRNAPD